MNNKIILIIISILVVGTGAFAILKKDPVKPRLGVEQIDEGREHVPAGQKQTYKNVIPTSGPHSESVPWQAYDQQVPNENILHNMEHGGVIVSYRPDTDKAMVENLVKLFTKPYSNPNFSPSKAIVMPRADQQKLILLASWNRILELDNYNEQTMVDYYLGNVNKSPEPEAN